MPHDWLQGELARVDQALVKSGANKHERAILLITECLHYGPEVGRKIVWRLADIGLTAAHAAIILKDEAGPGRWRLGTDGLYRLAP